jgi:transcriptional regulator with GAF, ATPase, and Fis domain
LNYDQQVKQLVNSDSLYIRGVAHRYRALKNADRSEPLAAILSDLKASESLLKQAGAEIALARTRIALGNYYLKQNRPSLAQSYYQKAWGLLSKIDSNLLPKDLLAVVPPNYKMEVMAERIIGINECLGKTHCASSFIEEVVNAAIDFSMATRGAFISLEKGKLTLVASRNLDLALLDTDQFVAIKEVVDHVLGQNDIRGVAVPCRNGDAPVMEKTLRNAGVVSLICVPAVLHGHTYGCLYLDNRLGGGAFPDNQLTFIRMLCSQIAVGISNIAIFNEVSEMRDRYEEEAVFYKRQMGVQVPLETIIGGSNAMETVKERVRQVATTDTSVLILGETGVGKELVAKAIHNLSKRKDGPFIPVNLAALPHELVASELFGHEKGAFTGASERQKGRFELADGGTIFLDEIGDLPPAVQVKLLRVLQEGAFERLGSAALIRSNFRVIAATNKDLRLEVEEGRFRDDLYYRLNVFPIFLPPLRERQNDITLLARYFLGKFERKIGRKAGRIPQEEMKKLVDYQWPGNVRELEHAIEKAVVLSNGGQDLTFPDLEIVPARGLLDRTSFAETLAEVERDYILKVLDAKRWRISGPKGAAKVLGLVPQTLYSRMKKLGIKRES